MGFSGQNMRCSECGSIDIGIDKNNNKYCRECGTVLEEVKEIKPDFETKLSKLDSKLDTEK